MKNNEFKQTSVRLPTKVFLHVKKNGGRLSTLCEKALTQWLDKVEPNWKDENNRTNQTNE